MAGLSVVFRAVDEISTRFEAMTSAGERALNAMDQISNVANNAMSNVSSSGDEISQAMERAAQVTNELNEAMVMCDDGTERAAEAMNAFAEQGSAVADAADGVSDATSQMEEALGDTVEGLDNATRETERYREQTERSSRETEGFGHRATEAITALEKVLVSAGIVVALKKVADELMECSDAAAEFETSVAKMTTVADTSILSAGELSAQINNTSMDMAQNVNALADSAYNAISAGVDTANAVNTVADATKLSVSGFTSVSSSLGVLTTALNAYQLESSELTNISDSLVMSQNLGVLTIDQLSSSMGKAISTASAYSVDLYNLESGYISLTKAGISVEESTTYISSMFNELGSNGSEVAKILQEETGQTFGQLMNDGQTLADVLEILYNSVDQNAEALMNLWGSAEAGKAGNAIINQGLETFNENLNKVKNATGATEKAYLTMTSTTEFATQRMGNSFDNLQIAIGEDLNPIVAALKNGIADVTDKFTGLINEHPAIVAVLSGIVVGIGALSVAVTAFALVTCPTVVTAVTAVTAAMMANPIFLAITAVVALTAAVGTFIAVLVSQETEYESWTASTKEQYDALQNLNTEYDEACKKYGETSEEASRLKYEMEELNTEFEANKQSVEEFTAECDSLLENHNELIQSYDESIAAIRENELGTFALIQKLEDLAAANDKTKASEDQMRAIIDQLNADLPDLALSYESVTKSIDATVEAMKRAAEQQANDERKTEQQRMYVDLLKEQTELEEQIAKAEDNLNKEREAAGAHYNDATKEWITKWGFTEDSPLANMFTDLDEYKTALEELQTAYDENEDKIKGIEGAWEDAAVATQKAAEALSPQEIATDAISNVQDSLTELCTAYDEAYQAAHDSISGQIGLFDKMKTETELSIEDMQEAMNSQVEYINNYTENLQKALDYGLDNELVSSLSDGSAESAGQLDLIIAKVDELGGTTEEAKAFVENFNDSFTKVSDAKDSFADTVAEMEVDFAKKMGEIEDRMYTAIDNMDLSAEAAAAAKSTMDAYINMIKSKTSEANSALEALKFSNDNLSGISNATGKGAPVGKAITDRGYAVGTMDAVPGLALVGENGPELINFSGGEIVYTADETENILSGNIGNMYSMFAGTQNNQSSDFYVAPPPTEDGGNYNLNDKTINLKIEGSGNMRIGSNISKEDVVNVLVENVKEVLMNIVKQEIMEEGDMSYEF